MQFDYKHKIPSDEARVRLKALGEYLQNRHGITVSWANDSKASFNGKYMVVKIEGDMILEDGVVRVKGKDPGMLWRKKAQEYLEHKLAEYLNPATPLDKLPRNK